MSFQNSHNVCEDCKWCLMFDEPCGDCFFCVMLNELRRNESIRMQPIELIPSRNELEYEQNCAICMEMQSMGSAKDVRVVFPVEGK